VEWAFRWLYDQREAKVILSGVNSMAQLEDNLRIFKDAQAGVMSEQDIKLMDKVKAIYESKVKVGCTGCGYCMPCPMGVNIPEIFRCKRCAFFPMSEFGKTFYSLIATASGKIFNCVGCKKCKIIVLKI
jgi:predicted aldo/keto reductase-like oxidoreductase